jgi:pescadillo protein
LQYLILSFGGFYVTEEDKDHTLKITHQVVDRPMVGKLDSTREYVQPQWIVDSLNNLFLLPTQPYRPGVPPPPHLSPFTDDSKEGYLPTRLKEIHALKGEVVDEDEEMSGDESSGDEQKQTPLVAAVPVK